MEESQWKKVVRERENPQRPITKKTEFRNEKWEIVEEAEILGRERRRRWKKKKRKKKKLGGQRSDLKMVFLGVCEKRIRISTVGRSGSYVRN